MKVKALICIAAALATAVPASSAWAFGTAETLVTESTDFTGNTYALIVPGISKDSDDSREQETLLKQFQETLVTTFGIPSENVTYLAGQAASDKGAPTAAELDEALKTEAGRVTASDRFIFYYRGQANIINGALRINLAGPDITHEDLAGWLSRVKCACTLIILDCPNAGVAIESLDGPGRIIICGERGDQPYASRFSGYFVPALTDTAADYNKDGRISLLEAYRSAVTEIDDEYQQKGLLKTENALLEDDGDGTPAHQPWEHIEDSFDGTAAATFFFVPRARKEAKQ